MRRIILSGILVEWSLGGMGWTNLASFDKRCSKLSVVTGDG